MGNRSISLTLLILAMLTGFAGSAFAASNYYSSSSSLAFPDVENPGEPVSPPIDIRTNQRDTSDPSAAYNSRNFEYLVIWQETIKAGSEEAVYGRRLNSDGDPLGAAFSIMHAAGKNYNFSTVVYVPKHNKYWITLYEQKSGKWDIWAKTIDRFGEPGSQFLLSTGLYAGPPAMAYNSQKDQVMVVYEKVTSGNESVIESVCYQADFGGDCGTDVVASAPNKFCRQPDIVYNHTRDEYLVGYNNMSLSGSDSHVYAKRCKSDLSWCSVEIDITNRSFPPQFNVALVSGPDEYLAVWRDSYDTGIDVIYARRVSGDGSKKSIMLLTPNSQGYINKPAAAYGDGGHYLVTFFDSSDLFGRFIRPGKNEPESEIFNITRSDGVPSSMDVVCGSSTPCLVPYSESENGGDADILARLVGHWRKVFVPAVFQD